MVGKNPRQWVWGVWNGGFGGVWRGRKKVVVKKVPSIIAALVTSTSSVRHVSLDNVGLLGRTKVQKVEEF